MLENVETIFDNRETMLKHLKKKSYIENMKEFRDIYGHYFDEMFTCLESCNDKDLAIKELSNDFTSKIKARFANRFGKIWGKTQADINLFMVFYVFPAILLVENPLAENLCDAICLSWEEFFPGNKIRYTTYEQLLPKFREKIFGIF